MGLKIGGETLPGGENSILNYPMLNPCKRVKYFLKKKTFSFFRHHEVRPRFSMEHKSFDKKPEL